MWCGLFVWCAKQVVYFTSFVLLFLYLSSLQGVQRSYEVSTWQCLCVRASFVVCDSEETLSSTLEWGTCLWAYHLVDLFTEARCFDPKRAFFVCKTYRTNHCTTWLKFVNSFPNPISKRFATEEGPVGAEMSSFSEQVYRVIPFPIPQPDMVISLCSIIIYFVVVPQCWHYPCDRSVTLCTNPVHSHEEHALFCVHGTFQCSNREPYICLSL